MRRFKTLTIVAILICLATFTNHAVSQVIVYSDGLDDETKELENNDYTNHKYKYLNNDFSINMSPKAFQKTILKNPFFSHGEFDNYEDSLMIVLLAEFKNQHKAMFALQQITFTWKHLSYHLWQSPTTTKEFASSFNIDHPYKMKALICDETNNDNRINTFIKELKKELDNNGFINHTDLSHTDLLNYAYKMNPQRKEDYKALQKKGRNADEAQKLREKMKRKRAKVDSINQYDWITRDYKYLDKNFNIHISSRKFNKTVKDYRFIPENIKTWRDSLSIAIMAEFGDWDVLNIATNKITYSWLRLSYHTWQTENEAKQFAARFGISHPWHMREFLTDEENHHPEIDKFFSELRNKVSAVPEADITNLNRSKTLDIALRYSPQRIADYEKLKAKRKKQREAYQKEHGEVDPSKLGVGCGKENCCQKQGK